MWHSLTPCDWGELMQRKSAMRDWERRCTLALVAGLYLAGMAPSPVAAQGRGLPHPLVYLRDVAPSIIQDIRYATANNFSGAPVPGYEAAECILTRRTAVALAQVQADLAVHNLSLKVYDCYRPERAVRAFVRWTREPGAQDAQSRAWHPRLRRSALISLGYIAYTSRHARGDAVDLTLVELPEAAVTAATAQGGDCTAPAGVRAADSSVDMGTGFDCLDPKSHTASPAISMDQRRWRETLVGAMRKQGFHNYAREWWHFTYGAGNGPSFDVPIGPRPPRPDVGP